MQDAVEGRVWTMVKRSINVEGMRAVTSEQLELRAHNLMKGGERLKAISHTVRDTRSVDPQYLERILSIWKELILGK